MEALPHGYAGRIRRRPPGAVQHGGTIEKGPGRHVRKDARIRGNDPAPGTTPVSLTPGSAFQAWTPASGRTPSSGRIGHLPYTHFSLALSKSRRFARWVAWNIDGSSIKLLSRNNLDFTKDPRLPAEAQAGNELYADNRLDRGHIARRADLLWGKTAEALQANRDSFYYSNITPQMDDFNQSSQQGVWGRLENALYEDVEVEGLGSASLAGRSSATTTASTGARRCPRNTGSSWRTGKTAC